MSLTGKYVLETVENYDSFLKSLGVPDDRVKVMNSARPNLDVNLTGNTLKVSVTAGDKTYDNTVTLGESGKIKLAGIEYDLNINFNGSVGKGTFVIGSKTGDCLVEIADAGVTQSMTLGGITSKKFYKRQ